MVGLFRDRTLAGSALVVTLALTYVACGGGTNTPVVPTGCANEGDCHLDRFPEGTQCLGGYCIPPGVSRECTSERMCREAGFPAGTTCQAARCVPPPVDAAMMRPDASGIDAAVPPLDAYDPPIDAVEIPDAALVEDDAPVSGAT
jgi:hypothetical protein